jgi:hypothetical protein
MRRCGVPGGEPGLFLAVDYGLGNRRDAGGGDSIPNDCIASLNLLEIPARHPVP